MKLWGLHLSLDYLNTEYNFDAINVLTDENILIIFTKSCKIKQ